MEGGVLYKRVKTPQDAFTAAGKKVNLSLILPVVTR